LEDVQISGPVTDVRVLKVDDKATRSLATNLEKIIQVKILASQLVSEIKSLS
jgi:hypothetical protein